MHTISRSSLVVLCTLLFSSPLQAAYPLDCLGTLEPSGANCEALTFAGCCDAWGRNVWCQDGKLYCWNCPALDGAWQQCAWNGFFYNCGEQSDEPNLPEPNVCSVGCYGSCGPTQSCDGGSCKECQESGCGARECGPAPACPGSQVTCGECPGDKECVLGMCRDCPLGQVLDCEGHCSYEVHIGDGVCDNSVALGGANFNCAEFQNDLGDCFPCTPQCYEGECGDDGCGGSCGTCEDGWYCDGENTCQFCTCAGMDCGYDPCGHWCGDCPEGQTCTDGLCGTCEPDCTDKQCGSDLCGSVCGQCAEGSYCNDAGQCEPCSCGDQQCGEDACGNSCGECVPFEEGCALGQCLPTDCYALDEILDCLGNCSPASWVGDGLCDKSEVSGHFNCPQFEMDGGDCGFCVSDCTDRSCGMDDCGLPCGQCPEGAFCQENRCYPCTCDGQECGPNVCGQWCGSCLIGQACINGSCGYCDFDEVPDCNANCTPASWLGDGICDSTESHNLACAELGWDQGDCPDCTPDCDQKQCGSDGCSGSCGQCAEGEECADGLCVPCDGECPPCQPDCDNRKCGDDGCGGTCGTCGAGETCADTDAGGTRCYEDACALGLGPQGCCFGSELRWCEDGKLKASECLEYGPYYACGWYVGDMDHPAGRYCGPDGVVVPMAPYETEQPQCPACYPQCEGKVCGFDGCYGECGACESGEECVDGACVTLCIPQCDGKECGNDGCGSSCGICAVDEDCVSGKCVTPCLPQCQGKACGDDGCGGSCGQCDANQVCSGLGECVAQPPQDIVQQDTIDLTTQDSGSDTGFDAGGDVGGEDSTQDHGGKQDTTPQDTAITPNQDVTAGDQSPQQDTGGGGGNRSSGCSTSHSDGASALLLVLVALLTLAGLRLRWPTAART